MSVIPLAYNHLREPGHILYLQLLFQTTIVSHAVSSTKESDPTTESPIDCHCNDLEQVQVHCNDSSLDFSCSNSIILELEQEKSSDESAVY